MKIKTILHLQLHKHFADERANYLTLMRKYITTQIQALTDSFCGELAAHPHLQHE